jgi:hypothetical protein
MKAVNIVLGLSALCTIGACATTPVVIPPAVTEITGKTCVQAPDLTTAVALAPPKKRADHFVNTVVDNTKSCLNIDGKAANYIVYSLPDFPDNHTITLGGVQEQLRTFAPIISILDKDGKTTRAITDDRLSVLGNVYGISVRPAVTDKYILVTSNPLLVGKETSTHETRIAVSTNYAYNPYGGTTYNTYRGVEAKANRTFSHEGTIGVTVQALKGKIGLPDEK